MRDLRLNISGEITLYRSLYRDSITFYLSWEIQLLFIFLEIFNYFLSFLRDSITRYYITEYLLTFYIIHIFYIFYIFSRFFSRFFLHFWEIYERFIWNRIIYLFYTILSIYSILYYLFIWNLLSIYSKPIRKREIGRKTRIRLLLFVKKSLLYCITLIIIFFLLYYSHNNFFFIVLLS